MRYALVLGNSRYQQLESLRNPVNDAAMIAQQLRMIGFQVLGVENAGYRATLEACDVFRQHLTAAGDHAVALLYYAGHGVQASGENYLLPVDVSPAEFAWLDRTSIPLDWLVHAVMQNGRRQTRILIMDACRNNPFAAPNGHMMRGNGRLERGLATAKAPPETLIAYSTSPGHVAMDGVGDRSLYAAALAETMTIPGLPIEEMFRLVRRKMYDATRGAQVPWEHSSLIEKFCLVEQGAGAPRGVQPLATMQDVLKDGIVENRLTDEEIPKVGHLIHKLKAKDSTGRWAYYFVYVPKEREEVFLERLRSQESIDLENYGQVIASCYGEEPSEQIRQTLRARYGFEV